MLKLNSKHLTLLGLALMMPVLVPYLPGRADQLRPPISSRKFDRQQVMLMNLTHGPESTGYYVMQSLKYSKDMVRDLEKAINQLDQVEQAYTRSRGRPDDHPLQSASERIKQAQAHAGQLELELREAYRDLKSSVTQTLVIEEGRDPMSGGYR